MCSRALRICCRRRSNIFRWCARTARKCTFASANVPSSSSTLSLRSRSNSTMLGYGASSSTATICCSSRSISTRVDSRCCLRASSARGCAMSLRFAGRPMLCFGSGDGNPSRSSAASATWAGATARALPSSSPRRPKRCSASSSKATSSSSMTRTGRTVSARTGCRRAGTARRAATARSRWWSTLPRACRASAGARNTACGWRRNGWRAATRRTPR